MLIKIFASGTNVSRLARCSSDTQFVLSVPYTELEQNEPGIVLRRCYKLTVPDDLVAMIQTLDETKRPSHTKIWDRPEQNKRYIVELLQSLVGYHPERPMVLSEFTGEHISCFQLWISADKEPMKKFGKIAREAIPDWHVVIINGDYTTGKDAEADAKREIETARREGKVGVVFVTSIMTARSWSVPEVQACILAYDRGSMDATCQKSSRCLTPGWTFHGDQKEYGHIVDLGFNTNRSEKLEGIYLTDTLARMTAENESFPKALHYTTQTINAFTVNGYGYLDPIKPEEMFDALSDEDVILQIANATAFDESKIGSIIDILKLIKGGDKTVQNQIQSIVLKVKNSVRVGGIAKQRQLSPKDKKDLQALITKARKALNQSATSVVFLADRYDLTTYRAALDIIKKSKVKNAEFIELFGIDAKSALQLLDCKFLPEIILDLIVDSSCRRAESMNLFV